MNHCSDARRLLLTAVCFGGIAITTFGAPEPARLDGDLWGDGSSTAATYIDSDGDTHAYQWSSGWALNPNLPPGAPCFTWAATLGDVTTMVIQASGKYRRCAEPPPAPAPGGFEPARLTASLSGDNGTQAAAVLVNSRTPTAVIKWPATLTPDTTLNYGTRCSTEDLGAGQETTWIIKIHGDYRKCADPATPSPEPVQLTEPLSGNEPAAAVFVNGGMPTSVVRWTSGWTYNPTLAAGAPCSTIDLAAGQQTATTIQANGNYRKCS